LIADASVWINLAASGRLEDILDAIGEETGVAEIALSELERGRAKGHEAPKAVAALVARGRVAALALSPADEALFLSLVAGPAVDTLDDGEAATLTLAVRLGATAAIDERKATTIASRRFPKLEVRSTADLLFAALPDEGDGQGPLSDALFAALQRARMRVPSTLLDKVAAVLGPERVARCLSLPASIRTPRPKDAALLLP
jgi:predicted nucleic acid-binding protein